jgi:hypothetical protein
MSNLSAITDVLCRRRPTRRALRGADFFERSKAHSLEKSREIPVFFERRILAPLSRWSRHTLLHNNNMGDWHRSHSRRKERFLRSAARPATCRCWAGRARGSASKPAMALLTASDTQGQAGQSGLPDTLSAGSAAMRYPVERDRIYSATAPARLKFPINKNVHQNQA